LAEAGFLIRRDPDTVRAPDLAFVAREHLPATYSGGWSQLVPDLVLEVERTDFRQEDVLRKVGQWLDFGVTVVWVLYLSSQCLTEFRRDRQVRRYEESDILTCEDLLPGFAFPLAEVFAPPDEPA
jgi:Uma2 family endonuclease